MKKIVLQFLIVAATVLIFQSIYGQNKQPEIYLNHVYIVLDSITYSQLFEPAIISEKLGNIKTSTHTTTTDSWSGKYLYGKNGYFEFFSTKSYAGAVLGDCGLGFMTYKSNDILKVEKNWKENSSDFIEKDTSFYIADKIPQPWFYSINIMRKDSVQPLSIWLMENTTEHLTSTGFTGEQIKKEIKWQDFIERKTKEIFTKLFDKVRSIELSVNKKEYEFLNNSLIGFGFQKNGNVYFNNQVKIIYSINDNIPAWLKTVETELSETLPESNIKISNNLIVHINGNKALWEFSYK